MDQIKNYKGSGRYNVSDFDFEKLFSEYQNPFAVQNEKDSKFINDPGHGIQPTITKEIISENQIKFEIFYQPFTLDTPHFLDEESFNKFIKYEKKRYHQVIDKNERKAHFNYTKIMYGSINLYSDMLFMRPANCRPPYKLRILAEIFEKPRHFDKVALVNTEWSNEFQHWIDRCASVLLQIRPLIKDQGWSFVAKKPRDAIVYKFWEFIKKDFNVSIEFLENTLYYKADLLLTPCELPWENVRKLPEIKEFLLRFIFENDSYEQFRNPNPENIVYLPRVNTLNKRSVLNNEEVENYLRKRFGDKFQIFSHKEHQDLKELVKYFSNAKIVIGLHGGAFYNLLFSLSYPIVIEFLHTAHLKTDAIFYWIAHTTGCEYWRDYAIFEGDNFYIPIDRLEKVLNKALNEVYQTDSLQPNLI
ncbi:beta-12-xylosyltransferase [Anaeramoeba ignava]|uniref:Beta-12-xylosyltransferase n=1 Tax=Anaeramoeba ignava TaxID=1746090 RepID=A0A9Q0LGT0_ANAIG|nr:beta-12-xylosyltransferase [Anaeramoeba ignava]